MCGIAALLVQPSASVAQGTLKRMTDAVAHRGPDGSGLAFFSAEQAVEESRRWTLGLGHRRLSILDVSDAGAQPMRRGEVWVTFNGEIYNFVELRSELLALGHAFVSGSDTEVLLAAWQQWGTGAFEKFRGMFALVLVDLKRKVVVACRDRLGIKPLYLREKNGVLGFASEIKQLEVLGRLSPDRDVLETYLNTGYEDQRRSFFRDVTPLAPGTWVSHSLEDGRKLDARPYWFPERVRAVVDDPDEAARLFLDAFTRAVKEHLRSDVPVGTALSGGLDSSAVVALVQSLEPKSLATFTATFPGDAIDERIWVERVLGTLDASPHFVTPTADGFLDELDTFTWHHDEPVGSVAQYAGWCVARLTREAKVPVTLNGQGGDEVLNSYWQSYLMHLYGAARRGRFLTVLRHVAGATVVGNRELLKQFPVMGRRYLERKKETKASASAATILSTVMEMSEQERRVYEIREQYLPRLLKWDDRNFMAFSVEGRYPFLDHSLIDTTLSFTPAALYANGWMKEPLRRAMKGRLPEEVVRRRSKFGFEVPQHAWVVGALCEPIRRLVQGDGPLWELTSKEPFRALAANPRGLSEPQQQRLFRAFAADRWLRRFFGANSLYRQ